MAAFSNKHTKMNKKILYLASLAIGLLSLASCEENKDFDPSYVAPNYFVGKWELTQTGSLNAANVLFYDDVEKNENCEFDNIILGADMSFAENDFEFIAGACNLEADGGQYMIVDGNLVFTYGDADPTDAIPAEVVIVDVIALTDTNLEVSLTDDNGDLAFLKFTKS